MKRTLCIFVAAMLALLSVKAMAQGRSADGRHSPSPTKVSDQELVATVYPEAVKLTKVNPYWFRLLDAKGKTVGFALNGEPFCRDEKGYNGATPVMIITDTKGTIKKVDLLSHYETPGYVRRLHQKGFFDAWSGKTLEEAKALQVDACTGATITSKAVIKNMQYLLNNGSKEFPKK